MERIESALMQAMNLSAIPSERPELAEIKIERVRFRDEELLRRFMGPEAQKTQESPELRVYEDKEQRILQVFSDGSFIFSDPADAKELVSKKMTLEEARAVAEAFLEKNGGLPEGAYEYKVGDISQGTSQGVGVIYYFNYSHNISGVPVEIDNITVTVGASRVLEYVYGWSKPVNAQGENAPRKQKVIPALDAVRKAFVFQFERTLGGKLYQPIRVEGATLVYTLKKARDYSVIVPAWKVTLSMESTIGGPGDGTRQQTTGPRPKFFFHTRVNALTGDVIVQ